MDIIDLIDGFSSKDKTVHTIRETSMSYQELKLNSDALASFIIETYGNDNTPVIVLGHKQHLMLVSFLASVKAGHAYIPVDDSTPSERIADIIENSCPRLIINISGIQLPGFNGLELTIDDLKNIFIKYSNKTPDISRRVKANETFYIIYTSGSTGKPKGVQITLDNLTSYLKWSWAICDINQDSIVLNQAPFSFDLSVMDLYITLTKGGTLYSIDKEMIKNFREMFGYLHSSKITHWVSTPSFAGMCLVSREFNSTLLPSLKCMMFCGETLPNSYVTKLFERFPDLNVINYYGPTECTVAVTAVAITSDICTNEPSLPVGRVKNDCSLIIARRQNDLNGDIICADFSYQLLPEGEKGEILILGESVSPGYYADPERSKQCFFQCTIDGKRNNAYRTGDEGYLINGMLYFLGRIDFQIKLNGYRIEIEDIENNLLKLPFIKRAVVYPIMKNNKIECLEASVVLNEDYREDELQSILKIKNSLKDFLPDYMIPRRISLRNELPVTANGKIDRKKLMENAI